MIKKLQTLLEVDKKMLRFKRGNIYRPEAVHKVCMRACVSVYVSGGVRQGVNVRLEVKRIENENGPRERQGMEAFRKTTHMDWGREVVGGSTSYVLFLKIK